MAVAKKPSWYLHHTCTTVTGDVNILVLPLDRPLALLCPWSTKMETYFDHCISVSYSYTI